MRVNQLIIASLQSEASEAELRELQAWRNESPDNERHYQDFVALWALTAGGDALAVRLPPPLAEIVDGGTSESRMVVRLSDRTGDTARTGHPWLWPSRWAISTAAAIAVAVVGFGIWALQTPLTPWTAAPLATSADQFFTGAAETATVGLRDGGVIRLAPSSRLVLAGTAERREVTLKGRAYFAIAPDESQSFRIHADAGIVTVRGTRFDLQSEGDDLRLIVLEGRVLLEVGTRTAEVGTGELARVLGGTLVPPIQIPDVFDMIDWLGNFLAFQRTPLAQVAREIERAYGVRIEISDSVVAHRTVTGWFSDKSVDEVLRVVCAVVSARCTREGDAVTIEPLTAADIIDADVYNAI